MPNSPDTTQAPESLIAIATRFMQVVWNEYDSQAVFDMVADDYVDHAYLPSNASGHADMVERFNRAFSEARHEVSDAVAQSDRVVLRLSVHARHTGVFRGIAPTGAIIDVQQYRTFRIRRGKLAEHWALFDTMALMQQIGALTDPTLACRRD
ncbi:ester cyclase [Trinickia sp. NRRL B-1857]|uniref:ester cyclase n=1 Tax=Trinickia sp. NRRL B-1857 TaxID=3162879 RepID=UPI003D2D409B